MTLRKWLLSRLYSRTKIFKKVGISFPGLFLCTFLNGAKINKGDFGEFIRSLNHTPYGYQISQDITNTAPSPLIEIFEVRDSDCTQNSTWNDCTSDRERSELSQKHKSTKEHSRYSYSWYFYLPNDFINIYPTKTTLGQFHQVGAKPAWMFQVTDKGLILENHLQKPNPKFTLIKKENLLGKWHRIECDILWDKQNGFSKLWVNDKLIIDYKGSTMSADIIYFKYGLYRAFLSRYKKAKKVNNIPTQKVYYSNIKRKKL